MTAFAYSHAGQHGQCWSCETYQCEACRDEEHASCRNPCQCDCPVRED